MRVQEEEEQATMVDVSQDTADMRLTVSEAQQLAQAQVQWQLLAPSMAVMAVKLEPITEQPKQVETARKEQAVYAA